MDTPEKSAQISTPLSRFEDSPVFNYISSLSPIKPVRSIHIAQTFHSLSFSSLPSVFTSPHVSSHKESRFLRRNCYSDASRLELSSGTGTKVCSDEGLVVGDLYDNSAELQGNFNNAVSIGEGSVEQSSEHLKYAIELPRTLKYDCSSPESEPTPCCGTQMDCAPELAGTSTSLDPFVEEVSQRISHEGEVNLPDTCQIEQKKDASECDWESLISDAADLLIFNSPIVTEGLKGLMQNSLDRAVGFCTSLNDMEKMQTINPISSVEQHEMGDPSTQPGETIVKQDAAANDNSQYEYMISNSSGQVGSEVETSIAVDCKAVSNLHRGLRRRCLDFEMVGTRRKNSDNGSTSSSSSEVQLEGKIMSKDGQLVPVKPGSDSSKRILPGIGLHLNALAIASRDSKNLKHETAPSARTFPTTTASLPSPKTAQECNDSLALVPTKTEMDPTESDVLLDEDVSQASAHLVSEDLNPNSPKKKRRRVEGEIEGCKRCNCKKSKCLKLYCECFAAGVYCIEPCSCQECFNKPIHEDTVLATRKQIESRNPLAFAPKVIRNSESAPEIGDEPSKTPASARHKRGCNCKKSNCLKKYCECYQGGVGCSINCRCEGCKNAFGRKDGSAVMETEAEAEAEEGTEACEKNGLDKISQKTEIPNNEEQNPNSTLPATPLQFCRSLVQMPFSSKSKPPRSFLSIGSSSALYTSQKYGKPNILRPTTTTTTTTTTRFEKQFQSVSDDDIPEVLRGDQSPSTVTKTSSPNGKRVSPHINLLGSSPGQRSSRKLILQSIPSFPSLTPQH